MVSKRIFDIVFSIIGLLLIGWLILLLIVVSRIDTKGSGIFRQQRIGRYGQPFVIYKIRSMHVDTGAISPIGRTMRRFKLDELPQLFNILAGSMSFVGPRPDIPGYYDVLEGEDRRVLNLKPGLISRAAIKYYNEEKLLFEQADPSYYNDHIIFPDKVRMNLEYYNNQGLIEDFKVIFLFIRRFFT